MLELSVLLMAFAAATCAGGSMERHHAAMFGRELRRGRYYCLRIGAWVLAAASYVLAVVALGAGLGSVEWFCFFGLAGVAVGLAIAYRPRSLPAWGVGAAFASVAVLAVG